MQVGADLAANSGRWVKLTAEFAQAIKESGLMPTKTPGISHTMVGSPGDIQQWLQIAEAPSGDCSGPPLLYVVCVQACWVASLSGSSPHRSAA